MRAAAGWQERRTEVIEQKLDLRRFVETTGGCKKTRRERVLALVVKAGGGSSTRSIDVLLLLVCCCRPCEMERTRGALSSGRCWWWGRKQRRERANARSPSLRPSSSSVSLVIAATFQRERTNTRSFSLRGRWSSRSRSSK